MPSNDPRQQEIRSGKKSWNSAYKAFSQKLKATKDAFNGHDNKLGLPVGRIQDPLAPEIIATLEVLSQEFELLVSDARSISSEQGNYSKTRRKKKPKQQPSFPSAQPSQEKPETAPDAVVDTLSRLGAQNLQLKKEASSRLSRLWQYMKGSFQSDQDNRHRIQLLRLFAATYFSALDFEGSVLDVALDKMSQTINSFQALRYNLNIANNSFLHIESVKQKEAEQKPIETSEKQEEIEQPKHTSGQNKPQQRELSKDPPQQDVFQNDHIRNFIVRANQILDQLQSIGVMLSKVSDYRRLFEYVAAAQDPSIQFARAKHSEREFNKFLFSPELHKAVQEKLNLEEPIKDRDDLLDALQNKQASLSKLLIKEASNPLSRFLKRQLVKLIPFNKTAVHRLDIVEKLKEVKSILKQGMDLLETSLPLEKIGEMLKMLEEKIEDITHQVRTLNMMFEMEKFKHRKPHKTRSGESYDPISDFIMRRRLRSDLRGLY